MPLQVANHLPGAAVQLNLGDLGGLVHLRATLLQFLEHGTQLLTQNVHRAGDLGHGFLLTLADVLLHRLNKGLQVFRHSLLTSLAVGE
ncbi:hypothetical protein D3C78_1084010 [compost metagenome]